MKWIKIRKQSTAQPSSGSYKDWKSILAEEGKHQCVYCTISENSFGGIRNFHVEHYRPKSIPRFQVLTNSIENLFYACSICNSFKGNDWPAEPDAKLSIVCYPDPSKVDYNQIFTKYPSGEIDACNTAGCYLLYKLYLNRPQLVFERREEHCGDRLIEAHRIGYANATKLLELSDVQSKSLLREFMEINNNLTNLYQQRRHILPYSSEDVSRSGDNPND